MRDLERLTGIRDTTLSQLERGDLTLRGRWLRLLAEHYQTSPDALVGEMERWATREGEAAAERRGCVPTT